LGPSHSPTVGAQENTVWLDVEPTQVPQAWEGVGLALRIGSLQLWWADLGTNSIAGLIPGEFSTLAFTLPEAVRSQLNASYSDLEVLITVNSSAPVRLDHLSFLSQPPTGEETDTPPDTGSPTLVCDPDRSDLQVTAVHGDLKDLWAGREEAETGKQTSVRPSVGVTFSAPIDTARLSARFSPVTCKGYPIAAVPQEAVSFWPAPDAAATAGAWLPGGFGVIAWNWVDGVSQSDGPVAAGQGVRLSSFSVNGQTNQRTAISAGSLDLTNGTIFGDVLTPTATTLAPSVSVVAGGRRVGGLPSFIEAAARLSQLSASLTRRSPNGTAQLQYAELLLQGNAPDLNIFEVASSSLSQASSIRIAVPATASVLINVNGGDIRFEEKQISLGGVPAGRLLWNAPQAHSVLVRNIAFMGSLLATDAVVDVRQASFGGTLISKSVTGAYNHFLYIPLQTTEMFGAADALTVNLKPAVPLEPGCEYRFLVQSVVPLDEGGSCLDEPLAINFRVAEDGRSPAEREINSRGVTAQGSPFHFATASGIHTLTEDVWDRYEDYLGLRGSAMVARGPGVPVEQGSAVRRRYSQSIGGTPVFGFGYFVTEEQGVFRSAFGRVIPESQEASSASPSVDEEEALDLLLQELGLSALPWVLDPAAYSPPQAELMWVSRTGKPRAPDLELRWVFELAASGLELSHAHVTASNGRVFVLDAKEDCFSTNAAPTGNAATRP